MVSQVYGMFLFKFSQMPPMPPFTYGCDLDTTQCCFLGSALLSLQLTVWAGLHT